MGRKEILVLHLPPYSPELNPIELVFQLLGSMLRHSNTRHISHQLKYDDFFLLKYVEVPESISRHDILKMYKKLRIYCVKLYVTSIHSNITLLLF